MSNTMKTIDDLLGITINNAGTETLRLVDINEAKQALSTMLSEIIGEDREFFVDKYNKDRLDEVRIQTHSINGTKEAQRQRATDRGLTL